MDRPNNYGYNGYSSNGDDPSRAAELADRLGINRSKRLANDDLSRVTYILNDIIHRSGPEDGPDEDNAAALVGWIRTIVVQLFGKNGSVLIEMPNWTGTDAGNWLDQFFTVAPDQVVQALFGHFDALPVEKDELGSLTSRVFGVYIRSVYRKLVADTSRRRDVWTRLEQELKEMRRYVRNRSAGTDQDRFDTPEYIFSWLIDGIAAVKRDHTFNILVNMLALRAGIVDMIEHDELPEDDSSEHNLETVHDWLKLRAAVAAAGKSDECVRTDDRCYAAL